MKAIAVTPLKKDSHRIIETEKPIIKENEVLVKVLEAGVCRTDLEIIEGLYGEAPKDDHYLVIGHESIGEVAESNSDQFKKGDLVVRTVRRPCPGCFNCDNGQNDMCLTGDYAETGIKGIHGIMSEYYKDNPEWLIPIPKEHQETAVLLEPLSFVEKVFDQTLKAQERMYWKNNSSLVLGSGPIGILMAMVLRSMNIDTTVVARSKKGNQKSKIVEAAGARYLSTQEETLEGQFDLVVEATGNSSMVLNGLNHLNTNGVLALTSITGDYNPVKIDISKINLDLVLNNNLILGVVNANKEDYSRGVKRLDKFEQNWPGLTEKIITKKVNLDHYESALKHNSDDIKNVICF